MVCWLDRLSEGPLLIASEHHTSFHLRFAVPPFLGFVIADLSPVFVCVVCCTLLLQMPLSLSLGIVTRRIHQGSPALFLPPHHCLLYFLVWRPWQSPFDVHEFVSRASRLPSQEDTAGEFEPGPLLSAFEDTIAQLWNLHASVRSVQMNEKSGT